MNILLFDLSIYFHITLDKIPVVTIPQFNTIQSTNRPIDQPSNYDKIEQDEKKVDQKSEQRFLWFLPIFLISSISEYNDGGLMCLDRMK